jgi:hypothetical protein
MSKTKVTKQKAFQNYLETGASVTFRQAKSMFKLANPSDTVTKLREKGVCVYTNKVVLKDGTQTTAYRIGKPSREIIAAGFAVLTGRFD